MKFCVLLSARVIEQFVRMTEQCVWGGGEPTSLQILSPSSARSLFEFFILYRPCLSTHMCPIGARVFRIPRLSLGAVTRHGERIFWIPPAFQAPQLTPSLRPGRSPAVPRKRSRPASLRPASSNSSASIVNFFVFIKSSAIHLRPQRR